MKITFVRHGEKEGDALTQVGREDSIALGREVFRGQGITHVAGTGFKRVKQTCEAIIEGADINVKPEEIGLVDLLSTNPEDPDFKKLVELIGAAKGNHSLTALRAVDHNWLYHWGERLKAILKAYTTKHARMLHLLIVAHSPVVEMVVYMLTNHTPEPLPPLGRITVELSYEFDPPPTAHDAGFEKYRLVGASVVCHGPPNFDPR